MNDKEQNKKKRERKDVEAILSVLGIADDQCDWSGEAPDCRYRTSEGNLIGIEVVRCSDPSNDARQMSNLLNKACDFCSKELEKQGWRDKIIWVSFYGDCQWHKPKLKTHKLYQCITEEVKRHLKYDDYLEGNRFLTDIEGYRRLNSQGVFDFKYVESVSVNDTPGYFDVATILSHFVPDVDPDFVKACITMKNEKLKIYRNIPTNRDIKEYWLFISIDFYSYMSLVELPSFSEGNSYDRIYICEGNDVQRLK